jgi:hypothetical protein
MRKFKLIKKYPGSPELGTERFCNDAWNMEVAKFPEFWQEVIEKDYEIVSLICLDQPLFNVTNQECVDNLLNSGFKIHSVRRLSDGEIFSIHDKIIFVEIQIIISFEIQESKIRVNYKRDTDEQKYWNYLNNIKKLKQPLFTTEDGVEMFKGDKYYSVGIKNVKYLWHIAGPYINPEVTNPTGDLIHFSTKEAAEKYVLMNKPCLSIKDVQSIYVSAKGGYQKNGNGINYLKELKELVKSRL